MTVFSCTFEPCPMVIASLSPRSVAPNQMDTADCTITRPITLASGAIQ
ncbi:MAG: hypothetical protein ACE368_22900 [Paracoccaceae bacterium]